MKIILTAIVISSSVGFVVGRFLTSQPQSKETKTVTIQTINEKMDKVEVSTDKKDSNLSQLTSFTEKYYNPKGILIHEIVFNNALANDESELKTNNVIDHSKITSKIESKAMMKESFLPNFEVGSFISLDQIKNPTNIKIEDVNFLADYRIIGTFKIMASTNYNFRKVNIGVITSF